MKDKGSSDAIGNGYGNKMDKLEWSTRKWPHDVKEKGETTFS
jgi:hypothetical protein